MLRAIIFDCDGVIANTEPLHLAAFQKVLGEEGIVLTEQDYYSQYLALDDRACFLKVFSRHDAPLTAEKLAELIVRKANYIEPVMRDRLQLFPGVADFIRKAAQRYRLAIASGALRHEVEMVVEHGGVRELFEVIVSAEDVARSKPDPEPFLKARAMLDRARPLEPAECVVIEDSFHGIEAAHLAGMACLAVTNSYPSERLQAAERVVASLEEVSLEEIAALVRA